MWWGNSFSRITIPAIEAEACAAEFGGEFVHLSAYRLVDDAGVDLGGFDAPVGEHLGDRIDVRAECDLERGKGMAVTMESK